MILREYQQRAIDQLYAWLEQNPGNPCLSLPTGSGKSVIIAELCRQSLLAHPTAFFRRLLNKCPSVLQAKSPAAFRHFA